MTSPKLYGKLLARQALIRAMHTRTAVRNRRRRGEIHRILLIRPDHLGDLLFATPALEMIREAFPRAHITGAVGPWGRAMWEGNPNLDTLTAIHFHGIAGRTEGGPLAPYTLLGTIAAELARQKYDLGIALRFDHWWGAALMWAAGIPRRWGYDTPGMATWLTDRVPYVSGRHEVEQNLRLIEAVVRGERARHAMPLHVDREKGEPPLRPPSPSAPPNVESMLGKWLASPRRVVIHPGTGAANKLWIITSWAEVANSLRAQGWAVLLTGSPGERKLADAIISASKTPVGAGHTPSSSHDATMHPLLNIAGQTASLSELTWVLNQAHIVLGVDSGPLHIATALNKPTLHLYGPTDETIWGPWGDPSKHRALRAPGTRPTMHLEVGSPKLEGGPEMRAITPMMVLAEAQELIHQVLDTAHLT
jgi:ADP-heptose:LPS heptosyltransferase